MIFSFTKSYLKPLYYASKLVALFPLKLDDNGVPKFSLFDNIVATAIAGLYSIFHLYSTEVIPIREDNFIGTLIENYNQYGGAAIIIWLTSISIMKQFNMKRMIENFNKFDDIIVSHFDVKINYKKWVICITLLTLTSIILLTIMEMENCLLFTSSSPTFSSLCRLMCIFPMYVIIVHQIQYIGFLEIFRDRFNLLNHCVYKKDTKWKFLGKLKPGPGNVKLNFEKIGTIDAHKMKIIIKLSALLHENTKLLNSCFGLRIIWVVMYAFFECTTLSYDLFQKLVYFEQLIKRSEYDVVVNDIEDTIIWDLIFVLKIFGTCWVAFITANSGNEIKNLLKYIKLPQNSPSNDVKVFENHVKHLSLQLLDRNIVFNACGLVDINLKLFFSIIGAITTYLIILIQFDVSHKGAMNIKILNHNGTGHNSPNIM